MFDTSKHGILALLAAGESDQVEFKHRLPPGDAIARTLTAFANSRGGILIIGVDDSGDVLGLTSAECDDAARRLREISISLLPQPLELDTIDVDDHLLLVATIESNAPNSSILTARGEQFVREGALDRLVEPQSSARPTVFRGTSKSAQVVVFVAMSFREEQEPALVDYFRAMQNAANRTGLPFSIRRIDLQDGDYEISQQIMNEINDARIVIADFTLNSPNVYFELGYARAKNCVVIQTARQGTLLEFDVRNWKTIFYRNATQLEERLVESFRSAYERVRAAEDTKS